MRDVTGLTSIMYGAGSRRYAPGARALHWITALFIVIVVPLGWMFAEFKTKGNPPTAFEAPFPGAPADYAALHKTIGLTIAVLVVARIIYRFMKAPPALPGRMAAWEKGLAHVSHWLLYAVLILMPTSGYIAASGSKRPISIVGLLDFPKVPVTKETGEIAAKAHVSLQFALFALLALHVGGVVWHLAVKRDALLDRMLPRQANAE